MFALAKLAKQRLSLNHSELKNFSIIGLCNFCINFLLGYCAVKFIPSGVIAVIFSLSIIISEIFSSAIDKRQIEKKVIISSIIGCSGLAIFILPLISFSENSHLHETMAGLALTLIMIVSYSFGNALVGKNKKQNDTPLYTSIAYGSGFGSLYILVLNLARGNHFAFDFSFNYVASLAYLVIIASVVAFIALFYMIQKIGSARANYTALVYPAIALITSAFLENYHFSFLSTVGFLLIISALLVEFLPKK